MVRGEYPRQWLMSSSPDRSGFMALQRSPTADASDGRAHRAAKGEGIRGDRCVPIVSTSLVPPPNPSSNPSPSPPSGSIA